MLGGGARAVLGPYATNVAFAQTLRIGAPAILGPLWTFPIQHPLVGGTLARLKIYRFLLYAARLLDSHVSFILIFRCR